MSRKLKTTPEILRVNGEVELIRDRANRIVDAAFHADTPLATKVPEVERQLSILDALCLNYLEARGKL